MVVASVVGLSRRGLEHCQTTRGARHVHRHTTRGARHVHRHTTRSGNRPHHQSAPGTCTRR